MYLSLFSVTVFLPRINRRTRLWMGVFIGIFLVSLVVLITTRYIGGGTSTRAASAATAKGEKTPAPTPAVTNPLDLLKKLPTPATSGR